MNDLVGIPIIILYNFERINNGILEEESEDDRKWRQGLRKRFHHL